MRKSWNLFVPGQTLATSRSHAPRSVLPPMPHDAHHIGAPGGWASSQPTSHTSPPLCVVKSRPEGRHRRVSTYCPRVVCLHYLRWISHSLPAFVAYLCSVHLRTGKDTLCLVAEDTKLSQNGRLGCDYSRIAWVESLQDD